MATVIQISKVYITASITVLPILVVCLTYVTAQILLTFAATTPTIAAMQNPIASLTCKRRVLPPFKNSSTNFCMPHISCVTYATKQVSPFANKNFTIKPNKMLPNLVAVMHNYTAWLQNKNAVLQLYFVLIQNHFESACMVKGSLFKSTGAIEFIELHCHSPPKIPLFRGVSDDLIIDYITILK